MNKKYLKTETLTFIINEYLKGNTLIVLEFGRLRSLEESFKLGDGWSTYQFALNEKVKQVFSVDNDERTIGHCKNAIPIPYENKIVYLNSIEELPKNVKLDFIYVDGPDDSIINFNFLEKAIFRLSPNGIFVVDDYSFMNKHKLIENKYSKLFKTKIITDSIIFYNSC
jgi:spermidine synthase